jgi:hypothetical protein
MCICGCICGRDVTRYRLLTSIEGARTSLRLHRRPLASTVAAERRVRERERSERPWSQSQPDSPPACPIIQRAYEEHTPPPSSNVTPQRMMRMRISSPVDACSDCDSCARCTARREDIVQSRHMTCVTRIHASATPQQLHAHRSSPSLHCAHMPRCTLVAAELIPLT